MNMSVLQQEAMRNFDRLRDNPYPGRGIVIGLDVEGENLVHVFWIMGRRDNSRNRVFVEGENGLVATEAADPAKVEDPSLIIYRAMLDGFSSGGQSFSVVSNGDQTDTAVKGIMDGDGCLDDVLAERVYEPDPPNFTSRITAVSWWDEGMPGGAISVLRKSMWGDACDRLQFGFERLGSGFGHCVTTYSGDGDPLPSFRGEPLLMPVLGNIQEIAFAYWEALNEANRVSIAVKFIPKDGPSETFIINKYTKVPEVSKATE